MNTEPNDCTKCGYPEMTRTGTYRPNPDCAERTCWKCPKCGHLSETLEMKRGAQ